MMFMIPMPPTMSEIEAIPPSSSVSVPLIERRGLEQLGLVEDVEVVVVASAASSWRSRSSAVSVAFVASIWSAVGDADADRADRVAADEVLLHGADRHDDLVVGILEAGAALGLEDADHLERDAADGDLGAEVVRAEPEVVAVVAPRTATRRSAVDARRPSGTCPARRRRRGRSGSPASCR